MKKRFKKLKTFIKKINKELSKNKDKYYWKRKYYKVLREKNIQEKRNEVLAEDLRNTYADKTKYKNFYRQFLLFIDLITKEEKRRENENN